MLSVDTDGAASRRTGEERKITADARDATASRLTSAQIAEAQRLVRAWVAAHPRELEAAHPHLPPNSENVHG